MVCSVAAMRRMSEMSQMTWIMKKMLKWRKSYRVLIETMQKRISNKCFGIGQTTMLTGNPMAIRFWMSLI
jgi:hypothetical protein